MLTTTSPKSTATTTQKLGTSFATGSVMTACVWGAHTAKHPVRKFACAVLAIGSLGAAAEEIPHIEMSIHNETKYANETLSGLESNFSDGEV